MSRSYKKSPFIKSSGQKYRKSSKKEANKKVRKRKFISNGKQYRKCYPTWDIYDYVSYGGTLEEAKKEYDRSDYYKKRYKSKEAYLIAWKKWFLYK